MIDEGVLSGSQLARLTMVAAVLLPGTSDSPGPDELDGFDGLLQQACTALAREWSTLGVAIEHLPTDISWDSLAAHAGENPASFEMVSLLVVGAYFMSPSVLASLGIPSGRRRPAPLDQAANELGAGLLDAVFERGSPVRTLADVAAGD